MAWRAGIDLEISLMILLFITNDFLSFSKIDRITNKKLGIFTEAILRIVYFFNSESELNKVQGN